MLSILLRVASVICLYTGMLVAFISFPQGAIKWVIVSVFAAIGAALLLGGLALKRFRNWKRDTGLVLLSACGVTAMVALCMVCIFLDDELVKAFSAQQMESLAMFNDYAGGGGLLVGIAALGGLHLRWNAGGSAVTQPQRDT